MGDIGALRIDAIRTEDTTEYRSARLRALKAEPEAFSATYADEASQPSEFWMKRVAQSALNDAFITYLARSYGDVVGMATCLYPTHGEPAELVGMWVAPEARRQGVGVALVNRVVGWATGSGAPALELWVMGANDGARDLYEHCGFRAKRDHRAAADDPCRNELRMELVLID